VFLEVRIAILKVVFKCPAAAGKSLLYQAFEGRRIGHVGPGPLPEADA
jgi:hypothetical protein